MPTRYRQHGAHLNLDYAELEWIAAGVPRSIRYDDIYHDATDPLGESRHVFLEGNRIAARISCHDGEFVIAETGFGSGLNFLQIVKLWLDAGRPCPLRYLGFEKHPLKPVDQARSIARFPDLQEPAKRLIAEYPPPATGCHRMHLFDGLQLDLYLGDALGQLRLHGEGLRGKVHAWCLDGFSPARNPEMWTGELFGVIAACSQSKATCSTYSAAGAIRRGLEQAGFEVERTTGFSGKRHMLTGTLQANRSSNPATHAETPGSRRSAAQCGRTAAVIGGGLAGSSTAWHLARKGWSVNVYEQAPGLEHGVNALSQLALRCRVFRQDNPLARFFLSGFLYSSREFRALARDTDLNWHQCGLVQLEQARNKQRQSDLAVLERLYPDSVLHRQSQAQLKQLTGLPLTHSGWHSPAAGWLNPLELCRVWLDHSAIECHSGVGVEEISRGNNGWRLRADGKDLESGPYSAVVIACGIGALSFSQSSDLPLKSVPGEILQIAKNSASAQIQQIIQGPRSIFPALEGRHCISASFEKDAGTRQSTEQGMALVNELFDPPLSLETDSVDCARAERCQSGDFAPVIGAAPDLAECRRRFAPLIRNARAAGLPPPAHLPGLFLNLAHGSHGLCSAPLAAEYLASVINDEYPPIGSDIIAALDPLRFLIRRLQRQQVD